MLELTAHFRTHGGSIGSPTQPSSQLVDFIFKIIIQNVLGCFDDGLPVPQLLGSSNITFVSVGHRPTLENFHQHILQITPASNGSQEPQWRIKQGMELEPCSSSP